jgi:hypothetical protein
VVPASLSEEQVEAALKELGIDATAVLELGGLRTMLRSLMCQGWRRIESWLRLRLVVRIGDYVRRWRR